MVKADGDILFSHAEKAADPDHHRLRAAIGAEDHVIDRADIGGIVRGAVIDRLSDEARHQKLAGRRNEISILAGDRLFLFLIGENRRTVLSESGQGDQRGKSRGGEKSFHENSCR